MVKLAADTSKKILPAPSTLMRAAGVGMFGSSTVAEPLFGVFVKSVMGKETPPLVERRMFTAAVLTGALVVPATFQVTDWKPESVAVVLGAVTANGPELKFTPTCMSAVAKAPPPGRLSRAVTRKFMVRLVAGSFSPAETVLLSRSNSLGKVRAGLDTGGNERTIGLLPLSGSDRVCVAPRSRSSQQ